MSQPDVAPGQAVRYDRAAMARPLPRSEPGSAYLGKVSICPPRSEGGPNQAVAVGMVAEMGRGERRTSESHLISVYDPPLSRQKPAPTVLWATNP